MYLKRKLLLILMMHETKKRDSLILEHEVDLILMYFNVRLNRQVDSMLSTVERQFSDMTVSVSRPFASNAVLHVTLGHVLKALIAFKGLMIERVVIKGYGETMDLWTESRHKVFRKVTENAHAAMLHFHSLALPELAVRSFMVTTR